MSAVGKEGLSTAIPDSEEPISTPWDILAEDEQQDVASDDTATREEERILDAKEARTPDDVEARKPTENERLLKALDIMDAYYFDGKPLTDAERRVIDAMGGEAVMKHKLMRENASSFDVFALVEIYFSDRSRLSKRQKAAIRFWAGEAGLAVEAYMNTEQHRYNRARNKAKGIIRRELVYHGGYDYDELSLDDADAVYSFSDQELQREVKKEVYKERRDTVVPYLAGRRINRSNAPYTPTAEDRLAIKYMSERSGLTREQLERRMREYAAEVYTPTADQRRESDRFVESKLFTISDRELEHCIDALGPTGQNVTAIIREVQNLVIRRLGLNPANIEVEVDMDPNPADNDGSDGSCCSVGDKRYIKVYAGYTLRRKASPFDRSNLSGILEVCDTVVHELFHAYQHDYQDKHDDKRAQMYLINDGDYYSTSDKTRIVSHMQYETQLLEREAWAFGTRFQQRLKDAYGRRRGFSL